MQTFYGIILHDNTIGGGLEIENNRQLVFALLARPEFATVDALLLEDAIEQTATDRQEFANLDDLAEYLINYYV